MAKTRRPRYTGLLPGEYRSKSMVTASVPMDEGGPLKGTINYLLELRRFEGRWELRSEWVDLDRQGHKEIFPDAVVRAILRQADAITRRAKSEAAKRAAQTRTEAGIVPFQSKGR